jgi:hypothetical protein
VLFIGTQFSNLYTAVDTPARGRVDHQPEAAWYLIILYPVRRERERETERELYLELLHNGGVFGL